VSTPTPTTTPAPSATIPPALLAPPPVVSYPTSTAPPPPDGYALYPVASPDTGPRRLVLLAFALVLLGAFASTAHAAVRRRALAGAGVALRAPREAGPSAHRYPGPTARRPDRDRALRPETLRPETLRSRIGTDGSCTCPSCARRQRRRRR
jgi:hypothetical protein